jgi:hypothetical protein
MDEWVEVFLTDVLALEGETSDAVRAGVRVVLTDCEQLFRAQELNKRMKDKAAHACHALCRVRVVQEIRLRKRTPTADHLKVVLSVIDELRFPGKGEKRACYGGTLGLQLARATDRVSQRSIALSRLDG